MNVGGTAPAAIYIAPQVINPLVPSTEAIAMVTASRADLTTPSTVAGEAGSTAPTAARSESAADAVQVVVDGHLDVYA